MDKEKRASLLKALEKLNNASEADSMYVLGYAEGLLRGQKNEEEKEGEKND